MPPVRPRGFRIPEVDAIEFPIQWGPQQPPEEDPDPFPEPPQPDELPPDEPMILNRDGNWVPAGFGAPRPNEANVWDIIQKQPKEKVEMPRDVKSVPYSKLPRKEGYVSKFPKRHIEYKNFDDLLARLKSTIIQVHGVPWYVYGVHDNLQLELYAGEGERILVAYTEDFDLQVPEPQYMDYRQSTCFLSRMPARQFRQGLNQQSCRILTAGEKQACGYDVMALLHSLKDKEDLAWSSKYEKLMRAKRMGLRLTDDVAVYSPRYGSAMGKVMVEFKGHDLGVIDGSEVLLPAHVADKSWIIKSLEKAGLETRISDEA